MPACPNCSADVPEERLEMHVAFCSRNVWRCTACGECMQRLAQAEHANQCSAAVLECECGEKLPRSALERHKKEACLMRTVECEFCEVSFTFVELMDHQEYCGSRTENCTRCLKLVKMREMERHHNSGCELYGSALTSSDNAADDTNYAATSLLSPMGGAVSGGASRSSPGLFACPYCGSEEASFDGLQTHIAVAGCDQSQTNGAARQRDQPGGRPRRRQAPARPNSDVAAALAGVNGDPPQRQRRTARDWDAEMAEALAGRAARRGGGGATASAVVGGLRATGQSNMLDLSDGESSDDEDWQPGTTQAKRTPSVRNPEGRNSGDADEDVSFSEGEDDWSVAHGTADAVDADLQMALQLSREAALPAGRDSMDEDLQLALAASRSEAEAASQQAEQVALPKHVAGAAGRVSHKRERDEACGGQPPPGAEVLVLDSSDGSADEEEKDVLEAVQSRAKQRRLKDT